MLKLDLDMGGNFSQITNINGVAVTSLSVLALDAIKSNPRFPFKTGHLRDDATYMGANGFEIVFDDGTLNAHKGAHYIDFLEYGTSRSAKHVGFIQERALDDATRAIAKALKGVIEWEAA